MQLIEQLLPKTWQEDLLKTMAEVTWIHQKGTSYKTSTGNFIQGMDVFVDENTVDTVQFIHYAILDSERSNMYPYLKPILYMIQDRLNIKISNIRRIKINHQSPIPNFTKTNYNIPHSDDSNPNLTTAIYYVNDSDGDTVLFNEHYNPNWAITHLTEVYRKTPKMGDLIVFPSTQFHASSNPIATPSRYIINFVFEVDK
jgi:hypothetical protein